MIRLWQSSHTLGHHFVRLLAVAVLANSSNAAAEEAIIADLENRLERARTTGDRFVVLMEIGKHAEHRDAPRLLAMVSKCTSDVDAGVRCAAVLDLAKISYEHKLDCPSVLIGALTDSNAEVRRAAYENIVPEMYLSLPGNVREIASTVLKNEKYRDVRASAPTILRYSSKGRKHSKELLIKAMSDRDFLVRNNAAAALLAHGESLDSAILFFVQSAFDDCDREFYSTKLGWSSIADADEVAVYRKFHLKILNDTAAKHPKELLKVLCMRLSPGDRDAAAAAIREIAPSNEANSDIAVASRVTPELLRQLEVFTSVPNRQVASLAQAAIDQLTKSSSTSK